MPVTCPHPSVPVLVQCPYPSELVVSVSTLPLGEESSKAQKHARRAKPRAASSEGVPRSDFPRTAPVALRSARVHAPARGARAPPAGVRVDRRSGARAERRTEREKRKMKSGPPRRAISRLSCGGDQPPTRFTRAVRGARAAPVAPARAAPSLRTERRPKRRRETRTTTVQEEDEERTTAARDVRAEVRRLEPPTRAPRGAGARARAPIAVAAAPHRGSRKSSRKSLRRASGAPAEGRTTSTNN